jgi:hypothetical protein
MIRKFAFHLLALLGLIAISACAALFSSSRHPADLTGLWLDAAAATATDSTFWLLAENGEQRIVRVAQVTGVDGAMRMERNESFGGQWWSISGRMSDVLQRRLCFTVRPRVEGACYRFDIDTVASGSAVQRRMTVYAYPINRPRQPPADRVFLQWSRSVP